jgi:hypothetical protein
VCLHLIYVVVSRPAKNSLLDVLCTAEQTQGLSQNQELVPNEREQPDSVLVQDLLRAQKMEAASRQALQEELSRERQAKLEAERRQADDRSTLKAQVSLEQRALQILNEELEQARQQLLAKCEEADSLRSEREALREESRHLHDTLRVYSRRCHRTARPNVT